MKLKFLYDIDKDVENVIKSTESINNQQPTKFQNFYVQKYGAGFEGEKIKSLIKKQDKENGLDVEKEIAEIETKWEQINPIFTERVEKIFGITYPAPPIAVYLTHDERCTYNIKENYFFIKIGAEFSNNTIMHELFHFYTWYAFGKKLRGEGLSKMKYNDIKESLTELLNLEFSDLMDGKSDTGYVQHKNMRAEVRRLWLTKKNVSSVIEKLVST